MRSSHLIAAICVFLLLGCQPNGSHTTAAGDVADIGGTTVGELDDADVRLLFVGNSHTHFHDVPGLVGRMMHALEPKKKVVARSTAVAFLDEVAGDPSFQKKLKTGKWTHVILQAQKISSSGRFNYSTQEGIDIAKRARDSGAAVFFFSEWGRRGVPKEGETTYAIYAEMAAASGAKVIPIGRAWDLALSERPDLLLHAGDGNHESEIGAFLTASVIAAHLSGQDPQPLATLKHANLNDEDRRFLAGIAAKVLEETKAVDSKQSAPDVGTNEGPGPDN